MASEQARGPIFSRGTGAGDVWKNAIGSAFGLGLLPWAPGTCGALAGVAAHLGVAYLLPAKLLVPALAAIFLLVCGAHFALTPWAIRYWQHQDPRHFVLDEVAGYLLVPLLVHTGKTWQIALWGFLFFRALDIIKIPPAHQIDRDLHGAWGILLDDLVSACYAAAVLYGLAAVSARFGWGAWLMGQN